MKIDSLAEMIGKEVLFLCKNKMEYCGIVTNELGPFLEVEISTENIIYIALKHVQSFKVLK